MRKQVQGGEGTPGHSELVVEQEAQTFRLHRLCAWQPHRGWDGGGSCPGDEARRVMQGCSHVFLEATLGFSIQGWSFGKILSDDSDFLKNGFMEKYFTCRIHHFRDFFKSKFTELL